MPDKLRDTPNLFNVLRRPERGLDDAVPQYFPLPTLPGTEIVLHCLQNLPLTRTSMHLSSFYDFYIKITPPRRLFELKLSILLKKQTLLVYSRAESIDGQRHAWGI